MRPEALERRFNPNQPRDSDGQWSDGIPGPSVRIRAQDGQTLHLAVADGRLSIQFSFDEEDYSLTLDADTTAEFREELQIIEEDGTDYNRRVKKLWDKASAINPEGGAHDDPDPESKAAWDAFGELATDGQRITGGQLDAADGAQLHYELRMGDEPGDMELLIGIRPPGADDDWDLQETAAGGPGAILTWAQFRKLRRETDTLTATRARIDAGRPGGGQYVSEKPAPRRKSSGSETLHYDPDTGRGTGYGTAGGDSRVSRLQAALNERGHTDHTRAPLKVDGKFGPKTRAAVKKAQRKAGLPPNGKVSPSLLDQLTTVTRGGAVLLYDRTYPLDAIQIQRSGDGRTVEAYAAMFDAPYEVRDEHGHYMEVIDRAAFNRTLNGGAGRQAMCLYNHGMSVVDGKPDSLAQVPLGTPLEIRPDGRGLLTVTRYNRSALADAVLESIRNGDVRAQSFRGRIVRSSPNGRVPRPRYGQALPTITRHELGLTDYGPTPVPVNQGAEIVAVRSVQDLITELQELDADEREELLRSLDLELSTHDGDSTGDPDDEDEDDDPVVDEPATPDGSGPGAEDPPAERSVAHSGRLEIARARLRMEWTRRGARRGQAA